MLTNFSDGRQFLGLVDGQRQGTWDTERKIVHYQLYVKVDGRFNCVLNFKIISEVKLMIHFYKRHLLCVLFLGLALH